METSRGPHEDVNEEEKDESAAAETGCGDGGSATNNNSDRSRIEGLQKSKDKTTESLSPSPFRPPMDVVVIPGMRSVEVMPAMMESTTPLSDLAHQTSLAETLADSNLADSGARNEPSPLSSIFRLRPRSVATLSTTSSFAASSSRGRKRRAHSISAPSHPPPSFSSSPSPSSQHVKSTSQYMPTSVHPFASVSSLVVGDDTKALSSSPPDSIGTFSSVIARAAAAGATTQERKSTEASTQTRPKSLLPQTLAGTPPAPCSPNLARLEKATATLQGLSLMTPPQRDAHHHQRVRKISGADLYPPKAHQQKILSGSTNTVMSTSPHSSIASITTTLNANARSSFSKYCAASSPAAQSQHHPHVSTTSSAPRTINEDVSQHVHYPNRPNSSGGATLAGTTSTASSPPVVTTSSVVMMSPKLAPLTILSSSGVSAGGATTAHRATPQRRPPLHQRSSSSSSRVSFVGGASVGNFAGTAGAAAANKQHHPTEEWMQFSPPQSLVHQKKAYLFAEPARGIVKTADHVACHEGDRDEDQEVQMMTTPVSKKKKTREEEQQHQRRRRKGSESGFFPLESPGGLASVTSTTLSERTPLPRITLTPRSTGSRSTNHNNSGVPDFPTFPSPSDLFIGKQDGYLDLASPMASPISNSHPSNKSSRYSVTAGVRGDNRSVSSVAGGGSTEEKRGFLFAIDHPGRLKNNNDSSPMDDCKKETSGRRESFIPLPDWAQDIENSPPTETVPVRMDSENPLLFYKKPASNNKNFKDSSSSYDGKQVAVGQSKSSLYPSQSQDSLENLLHIGISTRGTKGADMDQDIGGLIDSDDGDDDEEFVLANPATIQEEKDVLVASRVYKRQARAATATGRVGYYQSKNDQYENNNNNVATTTGQSLTSIPSNSSLQGMDLALSTTNLDALRRDGGQTASSLAALQSKSVDRPHCIRSIPVPGGADDNDNFNNNNIRQGKGNQFGITFNDGGQEEENQRGCYDVDNERNVSTPTAFVMTQQASSPPPLPRFASDSRFETTTPS